MEIHQQVLVAISKDKRLGKEPLYLAGHSRGGFIALKLAESLFAQNRELNVKAMFLFDAVDQSGSGDCRKLPPNVKICYHAKRTGELTNYATPAVKKAYDAFLKCVTMNSFLFAPTQDDSVDEWPNDSPCFAKFTELRKAREEDYKYKLAMRSEFELAFPDWFVKKYPSASLTIPFGNTLEDEKPSARYIEKYFLGSHGAIGEAPKKDARSHSYLLSGDANAVASVWEWMTKNFAAAGLTKVETQKPGALPTDEVYKRYNESYSGSKR